MTEQEAVPELIVPTVADVERIHKVMIINPETTRPFLDKFDYFFSVGDDKGFLFDSNGIAFIEFSDSCIQRSEKVDECWVKFEPNKKIERVLIGTEPFDCLIKFKIDADFLANRMNEFLSFADEFIDEDVIDFTGKSLLDSSDFWNEAETVRIIKYFNKSMDDYDIFFELERNRGFIWKENAWYKAECNPIIEIGEMVALNCWIEYHDYTQQNRVVFLYNLFPSNYASHDVFFISGETMNKFKDSWKYKGFAGKTVLPKQCFHIANFLTSKSYKFFEIEGNCSGYKLWMDGSMTKGNFGDESNDEKVLNSHCSIFETGNRYFIAFCDFYLCYYDEDCLKFRLRSNPHEVLSYFASYERDNNSWSSDDDADDDANDDANDDADDESYDMEDD